jgi:outer membrane protein
MKPTTLIATLALIPILTATPALAANLSDIYRLAREHDAAYAAARQAQRAGQEKIPQGRAGLLPTVTLGANLRHTDSSNSASGSTNYGSHGYSLTLTQPIYRRQNLESHEQARIQALIADQELSLAGQNLLLRVATAYFEVLQAEDVLATAEAEKIAIEEQLAQARKSFEVGTATITDTHEAQARRDLTTALVIAALNDVEVKRRALEILIDREAPALDRLRDNVSMPRPDPDNMDTWAKQAESGSLTVLIGESNLELARRELARQRGGHLPTLDLVASHSDNRNGASSLGTRADTKSTVLGVELGWVLYQGGAIDSREREAAANLERARYLLEDARRQARQNVRQGYLGVLSGNARVGALEQALVSSEAQLRSTKLGLEVGVRTRVDVLNAQQQVFGTRRDLAAARYQALLATLQLKAAAGILTETDLQAVDALLSPRVN